MGEKVATVPVDLRDSLLSACDGWNGGMGGEEGPGGWLMASWEEAEGASGRRADGRV
jgi:hypothetical protein